MIRFTLLTDSDIFSDGDGNDDEEVSDTESVFCRIEGIREDLEREMGFDSLLNAYQCVQVITSTLIHVCLVLISQITGGRINISDTYAG